MEGGGSIPNALHIHLMDDSIDSFVAGSEYFHQFRTLLHIARPNRLTGVLSHETGYIGGGHLYKGTEDAQRRGIEEIIAMAD
jgi:predicted Zn-dependent protease